MCCALSIPAMSSCVVVVDARSGEIRAVNRVVPPAPGSVVGMTRSPDGEPGLHASSPGPLRSHGLPLGPPSYQPLPSPASGPPPDIVAPEHTTSVDSPPMGLREGELSTPPTAPPSIGLGLQPAPQWAPPLPRPRPSELAIQKAKTHAKMPKEPSAKPDTAPAAAQSFPRCRVLRRRCQKGLRR
jgi:hypothetical protein